MEPAGKDGRGGEVSLAAPGHDGMPVRSRPTTALAIWSSVLQPGSLSAGRQQGANMIDGPTHPSFKPVYTRLNPRSWQRGLTPLIST